MLTGANMQFLCGILVIVVSLSSRTATTEETRQWTSKDGKYSVEATLVEASDQAVTLKTMDGRTITIERGQLSSSDQQFASAWQRAHRAIETLDRVQGVDRPGEAVDLLAVADPVGNTYRGEWVRTSDQLSCKTGWCQLQVPWDLPAEYQIGMALQRLEGQRGFSVLLPVGDHFMGLTIDAFESTQTGVADIDERGFRNNSTFYRGSCFDNDRLHHLVMTVHDRHVRVTLDGRTIVDWSGDPARLRATDTWFERAPRKRRLMLFAWGSPVRITKLQLWPLSGSVWSHVDVPKKPQSASEAVALIEHPLGHGSGFLADRNLLVTNYHVVESALGRELAIYFANETEPKKAIEIVYSNPDQDLAILAIESQRLPLPLAWDGHFPKGESVTLIGNPSVHNDLTLRGASAQGSVRSLVRMEGTDFFQLDAEVNPGSSGGPVINGLGQVVGVVARKTTDEGTPLIRDQLERLDQSFRRRGKLNEVEGITFAIPGSALAAAVDQARQQSPADAWDQAMRHTAHVVRQRLATLATIRFLEAHANVSDELRANYETIRTRLPAAALAELIEPMPKDLSEQVRAALQNPQAEVLAKYVAEDIDDELANLDVCSWLSSDQKRGLQRLVGEIRRFETLMKEPGTNYRRFSSRLSDFQQTVQQLLSDVGRI